ncbi:MAG: MoaD/ThiS family protein [Limnochordia bacterium]
MGRAPLFALDIGTRKIAGLLLDVKDNSYQISHAAMVEQSPGAMKDGQIHDIPAVGQKIAQVRDQLAQASGLELKAAAVAAAGRSLVTQYGRAATALRPTVGIDADLVQNLELQGVEEALGQVAGKNHRETYHCVGYHVVAYKLDDQYIGSLLGQKGHRAETEVICTFLPRVVVDSLQASLEVAGLEMASITLEPIAAINAIVPPTMRQLNIALVDIGAGTSDIAVTAEGFVIGFAMAPVAGDEITAQLAQHYLLDVATAEQVKRQLNQASIITCQDIIGNPLELHREQILEAIDPAIVELGETIATRVLELNEKPPQAVLCIGGGSLTPRLPQILAETLGIPAQRVGVRDREAIPQVTGGQELEGPMAVTPIGIALAAAQGRSMAVAKYWVNDQLYQTLHLKEATIGQLLLSCGFSANQLWGRPGRALTFTFNGQQRTIPGTLGRQAPITVDGQEGTLDSPVRPGARIFLGEPQPGFDAQIQVGDLLAPTEKIQVTINGINQELFTRVLCHGRPVAEDYQVQDGDVLQIQAQRTVADLLGEGEVSAQEIPYSVDGRLHYWPAGTQVLVNGHSVSIDYVVADGDEIQIIPAGAPTLEEVVKALGVPGSQMEILFNGERLSLSSPPISRLRVNGQPAQSQDLLQPHSQLEIVPQPTFILSDIFRFKAVELPRTGRLILRVNGEAAGFTTPLKEGDQVVMEVG